MPETIKAVETRYCWDSRSKLTPEAPDNMIGGVTTPANMARAC